MYKLMDHTSETVSTNQTGDYTIHHKVQANQYFIIFYAIFNACVQITLESAAKFKWTKKQPQFYGHYTAGSSS